MFNGIVGIKRGLKRVDLWRRAFWHVLFAESRISYSQDAEDLLLMGCIAERFSCAEHAGFWVDIGAHDPVRYSNTKIFSDLGWRGINVDAMPEAIDKFNHYRKRDININLGVGLHEGSMKYYMFDDHAVNTFDKTIADMREGLREVRDIQMVTLEHLLDKYLPVDQHIDFLTVDAEGFDFEILKSNNWGKYRPDYVLAEIYGDAFEVISKSDVVQYLSNLGYELIAKGKFTAVFKLRSL